MVPFAGWEMPIQYSGIVEEHQAVRTAAGVFDVSHMGRFEVAGEQAAALLRRISTYDVNRLAPGEGHYPLVCNPDGGILDDIYVFRLAAERFLVIANASNAERILRWTREHGAGFHASLDDRQEATVMLAVQGPRAIDTCSRVLGPAAAQVPKRRCAEIDWQGETVFASRTGYTGEDGLELIAPVAVGSDLWQRLLAAGVTPCGLGARDTLRLEAALLLYGNDIDEQTNPYEVGLDWAVSLDDGADSDFIGREALEHIRERGPDRLLACLRAEGRGGIMRAGCAVLDGDREVGHVTSGGFSPTLGVSIATAFLPPDLAAEGTCLSVDVRGKPVAVRVVPRPFYKRSKTS